MTNSDNTVSRQHQVLTGMLQLLDEATVFQEVDEPLEMALASFQGQPLEPVEHKGFMRLLGSFVQHIYLQGFASPRFLDTDEAVAEAVWLLESAYPRLDGSGYENALRDAMANYADAPMIVLRRLLDIIRTERRNQYVNRIIRSNVAGMKWAERRELARLLIDRLPKQAHFAPPASCGGEHAHEIPALIDQLLAVERHVKQILRAGGGREAAHTSGT